jgi:hypothetical protein
MGMHVVDEDMSNCLSVKDRSFLETDIISLWKIKIFNVEWTICLFLIGIVKAT